jgi:hypothetical protein
MTCARTQGYLAKRTVEVARQVDAKKATIRGDDALKVLEDVDELYATRGKRVVHVDLRRETPDRQALRDLLLGPTGNLRAPTIRKGRTVVVGFDEATYARVLG